MTNKITVTSLGTTANVNATPDSARYYSDKSKEWAIGEKLIDNTDYSSKYYANESKKQADISTAKTTEVIDSGNTAVSNIESAKTNAITDITNQETISKNNVITTGNEQVDRVNLTGVDNRTPIFSKSEIGTNESIYQNVYDLKHSTFDKSKFTVVGSPTITDDGVASFSKNNYITIPKVDFGIANTWKIQLKIKIPSSLPIQPVEPIFVYTYNNYFGGVQILLLSDGNLLFIGGSDSSNAEDIFNITFTPSLNTEYLLSLEFTGTQYIAKYSLDDDNWVTINTVTSSTKVTSLPLGIKLGQRFDIMYDPNNEVFRGTIDLKQFSITVDGKEVFSGNKTGLDVIKPDNYTIVNPGQTIYAYTYNDGSINHTIYANSATAPTVLYNADGTRYKGTDFTVADNVVSYGENTCTYTSASDTTVYMNITEDGVASGFNLANYITALSTNKISHTNKKITYLFKNIDASMLYDGQYFSTIRCTTESSYINLSLGVARHKKNMFLMGTGEGGVQYYIDIYYTSSPNFNDSDLFDVKISISGASITFDVIQNENIVITRSATLLATPLESYLHIGNQQADNGGERYNPWQGFIDLNSIKIYVDGNLVYQPCLKIPYTQSKTGSKIVDKVHRDRVIDLYEQEGQAGYYTIDEENKNFTLPMGEVYGMIGQRNLISSTVTETNRVDIYSDKTCLICGNVATAGTINLPIELANNNYFITLSTSTKTATSFTTTTTGDYILIGKVA